MNSRFVNSKRLSSSAVSNSSSTSSKQIKLRTIMKGRGSQQSLIDDEIKNASLSRMSRQNNPQSNQRLSASLNLNLHAAPHSQQSSNSQSRTQSRNAMQRMQNCEQELLGKQDFQFQYKQVLQKLQILQQETEMLIRKKIKKIAKKSQLITLKNKGKDQISYEIQDLVRRIQMVKIDQLEKISKNSEKVRQLAERKIKILEKLIAENDTQSELLKKYFFAISAMNAQERNHVKTSNNRSNHQSSRAQRLLLAPLQNRGQRAKTQAKQSFCKQSSNHSAFHAPKIQDYQTYRYKSKEYKANLQPLPRSSYKSEYLVYSPNGKSPLYKNLDNCTTYGKSRLKSSTYAKDYQITKADLINYKELDSYRNKFKNLEVSFGYQNKKQIEHEDFQNSRSYIVEQYRNKTSTNQAKNTKTLFNNHETQKVSMNSQAKSQYKGEQKNIVSNIKNRRLNNYKYAYKTLANQ